MFKMVACHKCALCFIYFLVNLNINNGYSIAVPNALYGLQNVRLKRQAGYVYDRPSISFNLPSRNPIVTTSTQAVQPVDRISMQMYYAYPAPADRSTVNIGFSSTAAPTPANLGNTGYNYGAQNIQLGSGIGGNAGSNGYNAAAQNTAVVNTQREIAVANSGTGGNVGSNGYNYGVPNTGTQNVDVQNVVQPNTQTGPTENVATGVSSGYSYGAQNSQISTEYNAQISTQNSNSAILADISTNAPMYLPPSNPPISITTSAPVSSSVTVATPADSYLPPVATLQNTPTITVSQSGSIPAVNIGSQKSNDIASVPNAAYLPPSSLPSTSSVQVQTQTSAVPIRQPQPEPTQSYLPPVVSTQGSVSTQRPVSTQGIVSTQGSISTPAPSYLPPVF